MKDWEHYTKINLKKLGKRADKKLGQNFLVRYKVVHDIVNFADIKTNEHILEIGGGLGILTEALMKRGDNITVIEKDIIFAKHLKDKFDDIQVIEGDALKIEWPENIKIIANLPYNISSEMIIKIIHHPIKSAHIMLQKEVVDRCVAKPGSKNYGLLSILCEIHASTRSIMTVGPEAFIPSPKVTSAVLEIIPKVMDYENPHDEIELLAKNLFSLRKRTVRSVIRGFRKNKSNKNIWDDTPYGDKRIFQLSSNKIDKILTYLKDCEGWPLAG